MKNAPGVARTAAPAPIKVTTTNAVTHPAR
jgi:hypothetical protein